MTRTEPKLTGAMTPFPYSIGPDDSAVLALKLMQEHSIRHLPAVEHFRCVGLISLEAVQAALSHASPERPPLVRQLMSADVYRVDINTPLEEVLSYMAHHSVSCAVVLKSDKVVGIFTGVDACRLLLHLLPHVPPDEAA